MQTNFTPAQLADPQIAESEKILRTCVHCGFCTATCPTYVTLGNELDRGTRPLFQRYKSELDQRLSRRFGCAPEDLRPWHYGDPFFQEAPAADAVLDRVFENQSLERLASRFFGALGLGVVYVAAGTWLITGATPARAWRLFFISILYLPALLTLMVLDKVA